MRNSSQKGQAIILVLVALSLFMLGAVGLGVDGANLYSHRQMAQNAADAAAQAGVMSLFNKTNTGANAFGGAAFTCTTSDVRTPCYYARANGFGSTAMDSVYVDFPGSAPGVSLSPTDNPALIRVSITRNLQTGLIRFLGPSVAGISAQGMAAILDVVAPVPIIVTHPTLPGSFDINGTPTITICGGPQRSIQVNSSNSASITISGASNTVDLSHAGPKTTPGLCDGTGGDFGDYGGPTPYPSTLQLGSDGHYIQPASPIEDPLKDVPTPALPGTVGTSAALANNVSGCPAAPPKPCVLYSPGRWPTGITVKSETGVFKPGLYYIQSGGFHGDSNSLMLMATGFPNDPVTGQGMVVYNTGSNDADIFEVGANGSAFLTGAPNNSIYKGILLFEDRATGPNTGVGGDKSHKLGGGGAMTLVGTIYITNTKAIMQATPGQYQTVLLQGNPGSETLIIGEIIASKLQMGGTAAIKMTLDPAYALNIRQVALVQ
jgi:hypothetical protein